MNIQQNKDIIERLNDTFRYVFNDDGIIVSDGITADDIDAWDSLSHITLVVAIEKEFGVKLKAAEVGKLKNVGEMISILEQRASK